MTMRRSGVRVLSLGLLSLALAACGADNVVGPKVTPRSGVIVLDGFIQPGLTVLADTGTSSTRIALGATTEFDGGVFTYERDTALAVSSRGAGDLLYIASLSTGAVRKIQLPAGGNAARARLVSGGAGATRVLVALRDSQLVATVTVAASGEATISRTLDTGVCPVDAFRYGNALWVVDANANCRADYAVQGAMRLIRIPDDGGARQTIELSSLRGSAASAIVVDDIAYITAEGSADFSAFPFTLLQPGAVARVSLATGQVLQQKLMPAGSYGASARLGLDGFLYVSLYSDLATFDERVVQLRPDDFAVINGAGATSWRDLRDTDDNEVKCHAAVADEQGRVHCLAIGAASATSLLVFDAQGKEVRRVSAGQGGVDLALRR